MVDNVSKNMIICDLSSVSSVPTFYTITDKVRPQPL